MTPFRILDLPSELQSAILEIALLREPPDKRRRYHDDESALPYDLRAALVLSLTHRQFRAAVLPFQYSTLDMPVPITDAPSYQRVRSLTRTLQGNPSLGLYCQRLRISIRKSDSHYRQEQDAFGTVRQTISLLPRVRILTIESDCDEGDRRYFAKLVRESAASLGSLQTIILNTSDVDLAETVLRVQSSSLRKVKMSGLYVVKPGYQGDEADRVSIVPISLAHLVSNGSSYQETGTSNISELALSHCRVPAQVFGDLVDLPNRLEKLTVSGISDNAGRLDPVMLTAMLKKHESSLKTICIRNFSFSESPPDGVSMDFSGFTALEHLQLYRWSTHESPEPKLTARDADRLLAPRLRKFTWDFVFHDHRNEYVDDIKPPEIRWLRGLAAAAVERRGTLAHIHANFQLSRANLPKHPGEKPAAWVSLDELDAEFAPQGIRITYPPLPF